MSENVENFQTHLALHGLEKDFVDANVMSEIWELWNFLVIKFRKM